MRPNPQRSRANTHLRTGSDEAAAYDGKRIAPACQRANCATVALILLLIAMLPASTQEEATLPSAAPQLPHVLLKDAVRPPPARLAG